MWGRHRSRSESELEAALRRHRPEPSAALVDDLARRIGAASTPPRREWSRLAFAAAISVFILGTFASFGGLSYAASGATDTYSAVKQVVVKHKLTVSVHKSSASGQYPPAPTKKHVVKAQKPKQHVLGVQQAAGGTLPFTGFSLLGTFVTALVLIAVGIGLRRRERRN